MTEKRTYMKLVPVAILDIKAGDRFMMFEDGAAVDKGLGCIYTAESDGYSEPNGVGAIQVRQ